MKKILVLFFLALSSSLSFAQTVLDLNGLNVVSGTTGYYGGYNIPRSNQTILTFTNSSFTTVNSSGYQLLAGDEVVSGTNNHLDGAVITGNRFTWNGTDPTSETHALFTGYNINVIIKYNYLYRSPNGIPRKSNGMTNSSGGVAYNILVDPTVGVVAKGMNNVNIYNNTFYSTKSQSDTWRGLIDVHINDDADLPVPAPSTGTKIFNNIFYTEKERVNINIYEPACLVGFESDYNLYYCAEPGKGPRFQIGPSIVYTFAQWQALGYDLHSVVIDPNFVDKVNFVPSSRLDHGTDLGAVWQAGLAVDAVWGTTSPATANQNGTWQVGARIFSVAAVPVTNITITGAGGSSAITTDKGTLQLSAAVLPVNATDKSIVWSITNGTGQATISSSGLVTAVANGTVTARATALDGSGVYGTYPVTISNQVTLVTGITVTGAGGATTISSNHGTLQLSAAVLPANATNKTVSWSVSNGTGQATISAAGLLTAVANGTVTARATATDGSGVSGNLVITISNQSVHVTGITVSGAGGSTTITADNGTLQLSAAVLPANATDKSVAWSVINGTGQATISAGGLVTAVSNGTITARATANDGSGVYGDLVLTISNQNIPVGSISVTGEGGLTTITADNGTLQLSAVILPSDATNRNVTWTITNGTGQSAINGTGLVSAVANGTVTARATASDGSGIYGTLVITISNQVVPVTSISVTGAGGATVITANNGTLQLTATVLPANATNKTVTWTITNGTGQATINSSGLVTAVADGTVTATATANDGSGIFGTLLITIASQQTPVTSITVTGAGGATTISTDKGTLQLSAAVLPVNATDKTVSWSVISGTGEATIDASGLVTAEVNGTVTARATSNDGSGIYGTLVITVSGQVIPVIEISVAGEDGASTITASSESLQLNASVLPSNATNRSISWSIANITGAASISADGLVTAIDNGTVTAQATANDGSGVYGTMNIAINLNNQNPYTVIVSTDEIRIVFYEDFVSWTADLYNLQGAHVIRKFVDTDTVVFSTSHIPAGLYIIVLSRGDNMEVEKVMVP